MRAAGGGAAAYITIARYVSRPPAFIGRVAWSWVENQEKAQHECARSIQAAAVLYMLLEAGGYSRWETSPPQVYGGAEHTRGAGMLACRARRQQVTRPPLVRNGRPSVFHAAVTSRLVNRHPPPANAIPSSSHAVHAFRGPPCHTAEQVFTHKALRLKKER